MEICPIFDNRAVLQDINIYWNDKLIEVFENIDADNILNILNNINYNLIHLHHIVGIPSFLIEWLSKLNSSLVITFHDFYMINGNPNLTDKNGNFSGIDSKNSDHQISWFFKFDKNITLLVKQIILKSSANIFPSESTLILFKKAFGYIPNARVIPHETVTNNSINLSIDKKI